MTRAVTAAAALGDRSENAEYKEGKRELRAIDRRLRYLQKRLEISEVIDYSPQQEGKVYFGAFVELENEDEKILICRIVGPDEINPELNHITIHSPMAKALLGKEQDDEVAVQTPNGIVDWFINRIWYEK